MRYRANIGLSRECPYFEESLPRMDFRSKDNFAMLWRLSGL